MQSFFLGVLLPWTSLVAWIVWIITPILLAPLIISWVKRQPKTPLILLVLLTAVGVWIRFAFVPNDHRIYFDEDRYLSYAVTFARLGQAVSIDLASPTQTIIGIPDDAGRVTIPVLNAIVMRLAGFSESNLYYAAKIFHSVSIIGIYLLAILLFASPLIGIIGSLGIAFLPTPVFFSPSFGLDAYFMDLAIWSMVAALAYARNPNKITGVWMISAVMLFICVRIESFVFLVPLVLAFIHTRREHTQKVFNKLDKSILGALFILLLFRAASSVSVFTKPWCCAEALPLESFALPYLVRHVLPNIFSLFSRREFPYVITMLALYPLLAFMDSTILLLGVWFILYFLTYSSYYAGLLFNPEFSGSYGRYLLILIPPLLLLAGKTIAVGYEYWRAYKKNTWVGWCISCAFIITLAPTVMRYTNMITYSPWDTLAEGGPRLIHAFLSESIIPKTPPDAIIIHNLTAPILLAGKTAVFTGSLLENPVAQSFVTDALKRGKKVYMLPNYRCLLYPDSCRDIMKLYEAHTVLKRDFGNGAVLELQQLTLPGASSSAAQPL